MLRRSPLLHFEQRTCQIALGRDLERSTTVPERDPPAQRAACDPSDLGKTPHLRPPNGSRLSREQLAATLLAEPQEALEPRKNRRIPHRSVQGEMLKHYWHRNVSVSSQRRGDDPRQAWPICLANAIVVVALAVGGFNPSIEEVERDPNLRE